MGNKSSIDKLPDELRKKLLELLQDPSITQSRIAEAINEMAGSDVISRSAVNRYASKMKEFTDRSQQAKQVAELYLDKVGENRGGTLGKIINEQVRLVTFELMMTFSDMQDRNMSDPESVKELTEVIYKVSRAVKELELASQKNLETEKVLRSQIADEVESESKKQGLTDETVEAIRNKILGV